MIPALLAAARNESLSLLSVMATLRCQTFWERLLVPPFIFFFKLLYPFALVARIGSRVAAAAGGCIFIETKLLRDIGAFANWSDALIDDCTLAGKVKRDARYANRRMRLLLSRDVVSTRGYARLCEFWQMVTRTAFTQLRYSFALLLLTTAVMAIVFLGPFASLLLAEGYPGVTLGALALIAMIADYASVARFYGLSPLWRLALPVAGLMFLAMTWHSAINYYSGTRATWKSRQYDSRG
jgi:hopene-associated glycosyltransferase HpnB